MNLRTEIAEKPFAYTVLHEVNQGLVKFGNTKVKTMMMKKLTTFLMKHLNTF